MLLLSAVASKTFSFFYYFFLEKERGGEGRWRAAFPLSIRDAEERTLPASRALKVKRKNGRSQRPKKNDILLVMTPSARAFVVEASAFNWKQVQCFCGVPHTHMPECTVHSSTPTHSNSASFLHSLKPGDSLLNLCKALLSARQLSSAVSEDTSWPGGDVLL